MPFQVNPVLTGIATGVKVAGTLIDSPLMAAKVTVGKSEFTYRRYNEGDILRDHSGKTARTGGTYAKVIDFGGEEITDKTRRHSLDVFVDHEKDEQYTSPQAHMESKTRLLTQSFQLTREVRLSKLLLDTSNYASGHDVSLTGTDKWSDDASDPFKDIDDAIDAIVLKTGFSPNFIALGRKVSSRLKNHPKYIDRFKGWKDTVTTSGLVPNISGLQVVDLHAVVNTGADGGADAVNAIYDNVVVIMFVNTSAPDAEAPSFFYHFQKYDVRVREMEDERADGTFVEEDVHETFLAICDSAGFIYRAVV